MSRLLNVHLLPSLIEPSALADSTVVVIDVLRATTTIIHALAAGAREVIPSLEVDEARDLAGRMSPRPVLGGERGGVRIEGFDLGNSPDEYTPASVGGRTLVFTTTNGTRAMLRAREARRVLVGAFVNLSALCRELTAAPRVDLLCAGTNGEITREDVLLAGAVIDDLLRSASTADEAATLNDQAEIAADAWRAAAHDLGHVPLAERLRASRGGRNMIEIGLEGDILVAAQLDRFDLVPELDVAHWQIRA